MLVYQRVTRSILLLAGPMSCWNPNAWHFFIVLHPTCSFAAHFQLVIWGFPEMEVLRHGWFIIL